MVAGMCGGSACSIVAAATVESAAVTAGAAELADVDVGEVMEEALFTAKLESEIWCDLVIDSGTESVAEESDMA